MGCPDTAGDPAPAGSAGLVGREREIRRLIELLDVVSPGRPSVLLIEGPAGVGRTRLLDEFAAAGRRHGVTVVPESQWTGAADIHRIPGRPDATGRTWLFLCDRPKRIDARAWAALDLLAESSPVLVTMTGPAGTEQLAVPQVHRIRLAPLSPREVEQLAGRLLAGRPDPELLELSRVAAGRPAAVRDLIAGLREEGLVRMVAGRAVLTAVRLPRRTRSRLLNQFAALSPPARHLVQAATTLRSPFPLARLARLLRVGPVLLLPAIDEVLDSGLLVGDDELLRFSHELVRPVVESSIPGPVAAALRDEHAHRNPRPGRPGRPRSGPAGGAAGAPGGGPAGASTGGAAGGPAGGPPRDGQASDRGLGSARPAVDWSRLTAREQEIAELAGQALTNRQIATRVGRSPHTVNYHLRQIFQKLDISSRVELAALLRQRAPAAPGVPGPPPS